MEENLVVMMRIVDIFETLTGVIEWNYWYELHSGKYRTLFEERTKALRSLDFTVCGLRQEGRGCILSQIIERVVVAPPPPAFSQRLWLYP